MCVLLISGQQLLAVCSAALGVLFAVSFFNTVQRRGQVSLAFTIFVLPILIAGSFAIYLRLTPFVNNHQTISALRATDGVRLSVRQPDQSEEWLRKRDGTMLPVWLVNVLGSDSLTGLREIECELATFQSNNFKQLDVSSLRKLEFTKSTQNSQLSDDLIDWMNACPGLKRVVFDFHYFSAEDAKALSRLSNQQKFVTVRNCESQNELNSLKKINWREMDSIRLVGTEFTASIARQLSDVIAPWMNLEFKRYPSDAICELQYRGGIGIRSSAITQSRIEPETTLAFARLGLRSLQLENLNSVPEVSQFDMQSFPKTQFLGVADSSLSVSECKRLAALFQCEYFQISYITTESPDRDSSIRIPVEGEAVLASPFLALSAEERESFWELRNLTIISQFTGSWEEHKRPSPDISVPAGTH